MRLIPRFHTLVLLASFLYATTLAGTSTAQAQAAARRTAGQTASGDASGTPHDTQPVIVCYGDSITAGYGPAAAHSYPEDLQLLLDRDGYRYRVVNAGVSGDTTKDGLARLGQVLARHPQIVVLEFGGNDGLRGLPVEQMQHNISAMLRGLQASGIRVALAGITLPPQYGGTYIGRFDAVFPALAKQFHVPLLPFILQNVYGVPGEIQEDGVHPTVQGNRQVAINVEHLIEPMLKR
jgi:acyl-CoA thioesterase-1